MKIMSEFLLTTEQLAQRWNMAIGTLVNWRSQGKGPPYFHLSEGELVRYRIEDIENYEKKWYNKKPTVESEQ